MKEDSTEDFWCHYSGMPSPLAYNQKEYAVYNEELHVYTFDGHVGFTPSYSPLEMIKLGIFGGNYFGNPEVDKNWKEFVPAEFIQDCQDVPLEKIVNIKYDTAVNKYGVICGMDYAGWMKSRWIISQDPYGWFNWYINFFYGRRSSDDSRQISRWKSFISRHSGMLKSICIKANRDILDESFGKKTRQNLLHWSYQIR